MPNHTQPDPLAACKRELSRAVAEINAGILAAGNPPAVERQKAKQPTDNNQGNVTAPDALL